MARRLILTALTLLLAGPVNALQQPDEHVHLKDSRLGDIRIVTQQRAITALQGPDNQLKRKAIKHIRRNPRFYTPAVFFVLADVLFNQGRRGEAMYWYYVAQLRARYDANRCGDPSVQAAVRVLSHTYGKDIRPYAQNNIQTFRQILVAAIQFEYDTPHHYDHRWINLHGMRAAQTALAAQRGMSLNDPAPLSHPQDEWTNIWHRTVRRYRADMKQLMAQWEGAAAFPQGAR